MLKKNIDAYRYIVVFGDLEECCMRIETHSSISLMMAYLSWEGCMSSSQLQRPEKDSYKPLPSGCGSCHT